MTTTRILTIDDIAGIAPAAVATAPSPLVSQRYNFFSTAELIERMQTEGFYPVRARQGNGSDFLHGKHEISFRHSNDLDRVSVVGQAIPEIRLINSHDRSTPFELSAGLFRLICSNGLTIADKGASMYLRGRHSGAESFGRIIEGTYEIVKEFPAIAHQVETWTGIRLDHDQVREFGHAAALLRWDNPSADLVNALTSARRYEDEGNDLWHVMNRVQENVVRGGLRYETSTGRNAKTHGIESITNDLAFNGRLWTLTEEAAGYFA